MRARPIADFGYTRNWSFVFELAHAPCALTTQRVNQLTTRLAVQLPQLAACCTQRLQSARCFSPHGFVVFGRSWNFLDPTHYPKCSLSHDAVWVTRCLVLRWFGDILISSSEVNSVACSLHCFQSAFSLIKWLKTIPWTSTLAHGSLSIEHRFVIGLLAEVSINVSTPNGRICVCCWTFL